MPLNTFKKQRGFLAIAAIVIIAIFGFLGIIATYLINNNMFSSANQLKATQAFYIGESGLEAAAHLIRNNTLSCATITGATDLTNYTFTGAAGPFTVTGTTQAPTTSTLSAGINSSTTNIPLVSAAGYGNTGRIVIDSEIIDYLGISGSTLVNARRGVDGTTASTHSSGAAVSQNQCLLASTGGVPNLTITGSSIAGKRALQEVVQAPGLSGDAWAVGQSANNQFRFLRWNQPLTSQWNEITVSGRETLQGVSMLSNTDAWAVGTKGTLLHWDGSNWTTTSSGTTNDLLAIDCTASNNCWVVGAARTFELWNGSTWTIQTTTVSSLPNVQYNGLYCLASNDCWAVGNTSSGEVYAHWNGSTWARDASNPSSPQNLNGVACTATNNCWAVGAVSTVSFWNGSTWSHINTSSFPSVDLNGVDCPSSSDCWIMGDRTGGSPVLMHWNGSSWALYSMLNPNVDLYQVRCTSTTNCWAVGDGTKTLHWDGSAWTDIVNPLPSSVGLRGVDVLGGAVIPFAISTWQEVFP